MSRVIFRAKQATTFILKLLLILSHVTGRALKIYWHQYKMRLIPVNCGSLRLTAIQNSPTAPTVELWDIKRGRTHGALYPQVFIQPTEGRQPYSVGFFCLFLSLRRTRRYSLRPLSTILSEAAIIFNISANSIKTSAIMASPPHGRLRRDRPTETLYIFL